VADIDRTDIEKRDYQRGLKHQARWSFLGKNVAEDAAHVRLTPQFSGSALTYVPWHFISDRPLQLLVRRLLARQVF